MFRIVFCSLKTSRSASWQDSAREFGQHTWHREGYRARERRGRHLSRRRCGALFSHDIRSCSMGMTRDRYRWCSAERSCGRCKPWFGVVQRSTSDEQSVGARVRVDQSGVYRGGGESWRGVRREWISSKSFSHHNMDNGWLGNRLWNRDGGFHIPEKFGGRTIWWWARKTVSRFL